MFQLVCFFLVRLQLRFCELKSSYLLSISSFISFFVRMETIGVYTFIILFMSCYLLVRSFESWCVYRKGKLWFTILICDDEPTLYREGKCWFSYATECVEFLNLYIWGHKAIIYFSQLKSLFFPQHASALVMKKKMIVFMLNTDFSLCLAIYC